MLFRDGHKVRADIQKWAISRFQLSHGMTINSVGGGRRDRCDITMVIFGHGQSLIVLA
jgi:hypothetical protein